MNDPGTRPGRQLQIRSRQTFRGGARPTVKLGVWCPRRAIDVALEECAACVQCGGLHLDPANEDTFVVCGEPDDIRSRPRRAATPFEGPASSRTADETPVSAIMTTRVICAGPGLPVVELERLLVQRGISGVPVVNTRGCPLGIASKTDLVRWRARERGAPTATDPVVADIMMPLSFCLPANESIAKAAALMACEGMHRVPVVGAHGEIVGLVSSLDVLRWLARSQGYVLGPGPRESGPSPEG